MKFSLALFALSAVALVNGHEVYGRYDGEMDERYDSYEEPRYDSYEEPRYDSYEEPRYDSYEEPRYDSYEEARYDEVIEEMDGRGSVRGAAPKSSQSGTHKHARAHVASREENVKVLESKKCAEGMGAVEGKFNHLLEMGDDELVKFFCNPIEREELKEDAHDAEEEAATEENPCIKALDNEIASDLPFLDKTLASSDSCAEELKKELAEYRKGLAQNGGRKLIWGHLFLQLKVKVVMPWFKKKAVPWFKKKWNSFWSDERLKENVKLVGTSPSGIPIYTFNYKEGMEVSGGETLDTKSTFFGVMAQDLLELKPEAVEKDPDDEFYRVDYSKIDVDFRKVL